ncbi:MAG: hydroxylamine reductase, partial [Draconibacterium sp.]|nr:hydroxylamine reductase [Draconibacterium sp.]
MSMFCFQCQEAAKGTGCTIAGVCGKTSEVANLQDTLLYVLKGISWYNEKLRAQKVNPEKVDKFVFDGLFSTITNANFDKESFSKRIIKALQLRNELHSRCLALNVPLPKELPSIATWNAGSVEEFEAKASEVGILSTENEDIRSLRELIIYGVKGLAAYAEHAYNLGSKKENIFAFMQRALVATNEDLSVDELVALTLETGKFGVDIMALLDAANTSKYGNPEATKVNIGVRNNPAILISGHDLKDMEDLLKQTEGTGVDVYTHSEMLPAHYYPSFKKYDHLVGNYGNAWWKQNTEFETFNGPILFTTNCIVPPKSTASYKDRIYTTGASGLEGAIHIPDRAEGEMKDFSQIIEHAKKCAAPQEIESGEIVGGFAHAQVFALADKIVDAVKSGAIKKFFVMAGCDGRMKSRDYYTQFAEQLPQDTVILTAGCAKYRYNKLPLGDI